ncbi:hypothetical protein CBER1_10118 [Cercospora berteroae]|uniref:Uncharacterized protein n=1 Tax=Cercospora berteroae TaxID=357750 RepID=A0A2S6CKF2_9PEZI|nr:hypothetical protein CBER1_10118 [Cercospora berteroae]
MAGLLMNVGGDSYTLRERLEALPQELYDMIYDFTFTAEAKIRLYGWHSQSQCQLDSNYLISNAELHKIADVYSKKIVTVDEIPHLFHVDRASRKKYAESFYGNPSSVFVISLGWTPKRLAHLRLVKNLRVSCGRGRGVLHRMRRRRTAEYLGTSEQSISFISYQGIEALLEKRAGVTGEACA